MDRCRRSTRSPRSRSSRSSSSGCRCGWPRPCARPGGLHAARDVLLVHVRAAEAEGWAECAVEPQPTYGPEFTDAAVLALAGPPGARALVGPTGDALALGSVLERGPWPPDGAGGAAARGARRAAPCRSAARWRPGSAPPPPRCRRAPRWACTTTSTTSSPRPTRRSPPAPFGCGSRSAPAMPPSPLRALREHVGSEVILQADANGSFSEDDPELAHLDAIDLACLEQPLAPDDLLGHARLAARLDTPICLDEPLTSLGAVDAAIALGRVRGRVPQAGPRRRVGRRPRGARPLRRARGRRVRRRDARDRDRPRREPGGGGACRRMALPPDLDPRGRFAPDLADPRLPVDGAVPVPTGPRHRCGPRRRGAGRRPRSWEPGRRELAARHPR